MKHILKALPLVLVLIISGSNSLASGDKGNGGDLQCDSAIQSITENIQSWIQGNGPEIGQLDLSSSFNSKTSKPYTIEEYDSTMLALLKKPLSVSCVSQGELGYPVQINGVAKVCINTLDSSGVHMICDRENFLSMNQDQQIQQVHHEFATDSPGLEPDNGSNSSYKISTQLSAFDPIIPQRKLAVLPPLNNPTGLTQADADLCTVNAQSLRLAQLLAQKVEKELNSSLAELNVSVLGDIPGSNFELTIWDCTSASGCNSTAASVNPVHTPPLLFLSNGTPVTIYFTGPDDTFLYSPHLTTVLTMKTDSFGNYASLRCAANFDENDLGVGVFNKDTGVLIKKVDFKTAGKKGDGDFLLFSDGG